MSGGHQTEHRIERQTDRRTDTAADRDREQHTLADYASDSTMDFLAAALPKSHDVIPTEPEPTATDLANWKLDETPVRCSLPDGVESEPGVRTFELSDGSVIVERPSETAVNAGGAR